MNNDLKQLEKVLRENGFSVTTARKQVFITLLNNEALAMRQLVELLPNINRASIYRIISLYQSLNITNHIQIGWKYKIELSEIFTSHHHHLICDSCNVIIDIPSRSTLENELINIAEENQFALKTHQIELVGTCLKCSKLKIPS